MRITSRRKTIAFFVFLCVCLVALAVALNVGWIILNLRETVLLVLGILFFALLIAGVIVNTSFLIHEIRRNEQHDSFINAVTHELKTPIASIRLYLETLQRRDLAREQRADFYRLMLLDTDRLLHTVEQVLKAGEAGYRHSRRARSDIDFTGLVHEAIELARTRHHLSASALYLQDASAAAASPVKISGDPDDIRTAVLNLLDNAVKYSGECVDVSVAIEIPDEKRVVLRVRDRGVGIPPSELSRVFRRFYRVSHRLPGQMKGTGLGLFIVRAIARKHGGRVSAESEGEGHGATFRLELPRSAS
jgi:two-component system, OmpR family, sensor histidine kinase SenX3